MGFAFHCPSTNPLSKGVLVTRGIQALFSILIIFQLWSFSGFAQEWLPVSKDGSKSYRHLVEQQMLSQVNASGFGVAPQLEEKWLNRVVSAGQEWTRNLRELEREYRRAVASARKARLTIRARKAVLEQLQPYHASLLEEIDRYRDQIARIEEEKQKFLESLTSTSFSVLVVIRSQLTSDLVQKLPALVQDDTLFKNSGGIAISAVSERYSTRSSFPFKSGRFQVNFLYPENISRLNKDISEFVYLFARIDVFPYVEQQQAGLSGTLDGQEALTFFDADALLAYLQQEQIKDNRLEAWAQGELSSLAVHNDQVLKAFNNALSHYEHLKSGFGEDLAKLGQEEQQVQQDIGNLRKEIEQGDIAFQKMDDVLTNYAAHFRSKKVMWLERFLMAEDGVLRTDSSKIGELQPVLLGLRSNALTSDTSQAIQLIGRPLVSVYSEMVDRSNQLKLEVNNLPETLVYFAQPNLKDFELVKLKWGVKGHHYQLLHLSRRVAGSQTQFGLLVARKLELQSTTTPPQYNHDTCAFTVLFSPKRFKLTKAAKQAIKQSAQCMKDNPGQFIHVIGHTDRRIFSKYGKQDNNAKLGLRRALSVMDALVEARIDPDRIATVSSKGSSEPAVLGMDRSAHRANRRVEVYSDPTL